MKKNKLLSISEYANKCGVSKTVVYKRVKLGYIHAITDNGMTLIDAVKYPPVKAQQPGRPTFRQLLAKTALNNTF